MSMIDLYSSWRIVSIDLEDIGSLDIEDFSQRFRCEQPTLLVYAFKELPWVGVAKCAPLNYMLRATEIEGNGQFDKEYEWVTSLLEDKSVYDAFRRELKRAGISRNAVPRVLLGPYCQWGAYLGKSSLAFRTGTATIGQFRVSGRVVPVSFKESLIAFYTRQLAQFGYHAFWPAEEGEEESEETHIWFNNRLVGYKDASVLLHPTTASNPDSADRLRAIDGRFEEVKALVQRLERGEHWAYSLHYHDAVRPPPTLMLKTFFPDFPKTERDIELYGYRARLIRLLGWPSLYNSVRSRECFDSVTTLAEGPLATSKPYSFVEEILGFKAEMEARYPVLLENPLANLGRSIDGNK